MKKLMFAAVALATGVVMADGITSANIVGYSTTSTDGKTSPSFGATFVPVSGASTYKLSEIKPTNSTYGRDLLQILDPNTTVTVASYTYFSQDEAETGKILKPAIDWDSYIGWWDIEKGGYKNQDAFSDNVEINVGQGFLGAMKGGDDNSVDLQCSGSAPIVTTQISTDGNTSPYIANYIPRAISLKMIVPVNSTYGKDILQVLDPDTTVTTASYTYFSQAEAEMGKVLKPAIDWDSYVGWWDIEKGGYKNSDARADEVVIQPGAAFLGAMKGGDENVVTFQFPSSTASID